MWVTMSAQIGRGKNIVGGVSGDLRRRHRRSFKASIQEQRIGGVRMRKALVLGILGFVLFLCGCEPGFFATLYFLTRPKPPKKLTLTIISDYGEPKPHRRHTSLQKGLHHQRILRHCRLRYLHKIQIHPCCQQHLVCGRHGIIQRERAELVAGVQDDSRRYNRRWRLRPRPCCRRHIQRAQPGLCWQEDLSEGC